MRRALFILPILLCGPALAQTPIASNSGNAQPIEITATKSVEWLRNNNQYVARENVVASQGGFTIKSSLLTADYKEGEKSSMQIWQMTAQDNVTILSDGNTATGDKAVYNVETGLATLTGNNLKLVSPDQTVTARDRMEYHSVSRQAKAIGNAKVVRGTDTLAANMITATFIDKEAAPSKPQQNSAGPMGGGNVEKIEAEGNVVITTPTEILRGSRGIYHAATNTAELIGNVKIERGQNILEGERAEVNLTTNVSKMFGSTKTNGGDGRVRGIFYPGSDKPANQGAQQAPKKPANPPISAPSSALPLDTVPSAPVPSAPAAPASPEMF
jgi:lipopolysaccharide export system protein LptA